ncbi:hypothetical protein ACQ4PT_011085 [Festuca glaucescens]
MKLKARANNEMAGVAVAAISSLQALLAHLWRAVSRARRLPPGQEASYALLIGCRGRLSGIPPGYVGNAIVFRMIKGCTVGEILDKGLGWTAWQLNRAVASFDEAATREWLDRWAREPTFLPPVSSDGGGARMMASSSWFDVFGNDFGWGEAGGRAERLRGQERRQGDCVRGARAGKEHVAGGVAGASSAAEARRRPRVHGRRQRDSQSFILATCRVFRAGKHVHAVLYRNLHHTTSVPI